MQPQGVRSLRGSAGRIVLERDTWLVENFKNPKEIQTLKDGQMKHKVQASHGTLRISACGLARATLRAGNSSSRFHWFAAGVRNTN